MADPCLFSWQAIDLQGQLQQGDLLAANKQAASEHIITQGLQPLRIVSHGRVGKGHWKPAERSALFQQLATLLQAGLPLMESLTLLAEGHPRAGWRCVLRELATAIAGGLPFSAVLAHYPAVFPAICVQMMEVGELTGNIDHCCQQFSQLEERAQRLRQMIRKAVRYPLIVSAIVLLVCILMLTLVLPAFAAIYQSFNAPLPWFTRALITASGYLTTQGPWLLLLLSLTGLAYRFRLHPQPRWQQREQQVVLRLPLIAGLVQGGSIAQIFSTLALTQRAGLDLLTGLQAAARAVPNLCYQQAVMRVREQVGQGVPLHQALTLEPLFTPLCRQLTRVGEESGSLDTLLVRLAQWYEQQTLQQAEGLAQTLEPLMMVVTGCVVGGLVIAMYLPIFQLGSVMGNG